MKKILQTNEKPARTTVQSGGVLRMIAKEIPLREIVTPKIKKILKEMSESLKSQSDGVAIAAPQIGYSLRIFVVSGRVLKAESSRSGSLEAEFAERGLSQADGPRRNAPLVSGDSDPEQQTSDFKDLIFINPKISKLSREKDWVPEGCLSVRPMYGKTFRSKKATVSAYDENGKKFTRGASGLLAQIFQHETDHLDGILFIDHAKDVKAEAPIK